MSKETRARRIAAAAAFGGGGIGAIGAALVGVLVTEVRWARQLIGSVFDDNGPGGEGVYGAGAGDPIVFAMLGDSTSLGLGCETPAQTPGVVVANALAALTGRPVELVLEGVSGAESTALEAQVTRLLARHPRPDLVVIMVGANDVTHRRRPTVAVRCLEGAVRRLREVDTEVVVGTCPDLGTIEPIGYPLKLLARRWSRDLAAAQTIGVVEAGGRTVSLGDLLGPEFLARPKELFSEDRFHPSAAGYARAAAAMIPTAASALGCWPGEEQPVRARPGERIDDIAHAAVRAAGQAGTEVAGIEVSGSQRGPAGRWALLRRRRPQLPPREPAAPADPAADPASSEPGPGDPGPGDPGPGDPEREQDGGQIRTAGVASTTGDPGAD